MLAADGFARDEKNVVKAIRLRSLTAAAQDSVSLYSAAAPIPGEEVHRCGRALRRVARGRDPA